MIRKLALAMLVIGGAMVMRGKPADAACNPAGQHPQMFAGLWNGSAFPYTYGVRASILRAPIELDNDGCSVGSPYTVATAHINLGPYSFIEYGYVVHKNSSNYTLNIFREAFSGGLAVSSFNAETTPTCNTLNGTSYIRFMAEANSGTKWYGGYNCSNSDASMSFSATVDFGPSGSTIGYALTEMERHATTSWSRPTYSSLKYWTLSNTLVNWAPAIRAWGDADSTFFIGASSATSWTATLGANPAGYTCTQPSQPPGYSNPAPCI
jgi:hypothetical protein